MSENRATTTIVIILLAGAYTATRFWNLTASCLWFDEIFSVHAATQSWDSILSFVALDLIHLPLFYVLLKLWIGVGGEGLFWLRLFPVIFSVASLFPLLSLLRELKQDKLTQLICLFFLTVNGSLLKYSQEVRMYSLLMCLSHFSIWLFTRYFIKGKSYIPLVIINILLIYTHYFGWFVILSEVAAILVFQRIKWRRIIAMFAVTSVAFIPWMIAVWQAAQTGTGLAQNIGWMARPGISAIAQFKLNLIEPFYYQASSIDPISIFRISIPLILIIGVALVLYVFNLKRQSDDDRRAVHLMVIFTALPAIAAFVLSWLLPYSIWGTRHLIIVFAPVSIVIGITVTRIPIPALRTAVLTLVILFGGYAFVQQSLRPAKRYSWCAWEPLADYSTMAPHNSSEPKTLFVFEDLVAYHLWFTLRDQNLRVVKINNPDGVNEDKAYFLPRGFNGIESVDFADINDKTLWLAHRSTVISESEPPIRNFLDKGYKIANKKVLTADREDAGIFFLER